MKRVLPLLLLAAAAHGQKRAVESVVPSLAYSAACSSSVRLQNLSDRAVTVDLEGHRASGALIPVVGHPAIAVILEPGARASFKLQIEEDTASAWAKVREWVPSPAQSPVVSVAGATDCVAGNQLRTVPRDVVFPTSNPWYAGDVTELRGSLVSLINTSERAVKASLCYSSGTLFSEGKSADLTPVCSNVSDVQVPPFGAREFAVSREGSTHFSIKTAGAAVVLEMLRPVDPGVKLYKVDSTIQFGGEVITGK